MTERDESAGLRIGYLVQQFAPEVGAGPARVGEMAAHWVARGASVTVLTAMPNRPQGIIHPDYRGRLFVDETVGGLRVLRSWLYASPKHGFARTVLNNLTFMASSAAHGLARGGGVDVLIASSPPFFPHLGGVFLSTLRRLPLVLEIRDLWPDYLADMGVLRGAPLRALYALERALLRRATHVVVVTESFRGRVVEKGVPAERITVLPNGVDATFYRRADEPPPLPALARRAPDEFLVGYLGNIGAGQGLGVVVDAAALLATRAPDVRFVIAGDGPERAGLERALAERRLTNVSIHPPIPKDATRAFYNALDVCLVPLAPVAVFQETIPSKIFEVLACERPVLAALRGEAARIVDASGGGMHVAPGDASAIADAVLALRDAGADARAEMGRRGRDYVIAHYSRQSIAEQYLTLLREVASGARRNGHRRGGRP